jgi:flagellar biosynthetic protein FliQ
MSGGAFRVPRDHDNGGSGRLSQADVFNILQSAMVIALELSMPVLIVGMVVGVSISIFQAVTQINDQTLSLVPKIIAVFATVGILGPWMFHQLMQFATQMLTRQPGIGA